MWPFDRKGAQIDKALEVLQYAYQDNRQMLNQDMLFAIEDVTFNHTQDIPTLWQNARDFEREDWHVNGALTHSMNPEKLSPVGKALSLGLKVIEAGDTLNPVARQVIAAITLKNRHSDIPLDVYYTARAAATATNPVNARN
jgi:hypothetical protein